jgi:hypothetical protein
MLPRQRIRMQQYENCWMCRFLCGLGRIKGSRRLVLPRISFFKITKVGKIHLKLNLKKILESLNISKEFLNVCLLLRHIFRINFLFKLTYVTSFHAEISIAEISELAKCS